MFPMRLSTIFKNRWWALFWAAGIIWAAYDFVAAQPQDQTVDNSASIDATGAPLSDQDANKIAHAL